MDHSGWTNGRMDEWTDGRMDGWTDGQDGQDIDRFSTQEYIHSNQQHELENCTWTLPFVHCVVPRYVDYPPSQWKPQCSGSMPCRVVCHLLEVFVSHDCSTQKVNNK